MISDYEVLERLGEVRLHVRFIGQARLHLCSVGQGGPVRRSFINCLWGLL
jgi:hypothetical protein